MLSFLTREQWDSKNEERFVYVYGKVCCWRYIVNWSPCYVNIRKYGFEKSNANKIFIYHIMREINYLQHVKYFFEWILFQCIFIFFFLSFTKIFVKRQTPWYFTVHPQMTIEILRECESWILTHTRGERMWLTINVTNFNWSWFIK